MTSAALMAWVLLHGCVPPSLAPIAVGIAMQESSGNTMAVHRNPNGTTDYGLAQINSVNFSWLSQSMHTPINPQTVLDPCTNLQAALHVLFVHYNGNPPDVGKAAYANGVLSHIRPIDGAAALVPSPVEPPCAPGWDAWAVATCNRPASTLNPVTTGASVVTVSTVKENTP